MIPVFGSKVGEEELAQVKEAIQNQWLGLGEKVSLFEQRFADRINANHFLMVDSGSNALFMAVKLLGLPSGSEVILPAFTWVSCASSILLAGHKPVFCDVDESTQNVTADTIKPHITDKTAAIMVVHYAGKPVEMDEIISLGFPIIEDSAHAVDSTYKGQHCGTIGDVGIFSFDPVKNLTTGTGGGLAMPTEERYLHARKLRHCGLGSSGFESLGTHKKRWWEKEVSDIFIRMLPTDIAAGIGLAQLKKLDDHQAYRENIWARYSSAFSTLDWLKVPTEPASHERHSYFSYFIRIKKRDELASYLLKKGIYTKLDFHPLHLNPIFDSNVSLPVSEKLNEQGLNIPLHPNLTGKDVEFVISAIKEFDGAT